MALADLAALKLHLDIVSAAKDDLLQQLLDQSSAAIERYCDRRFDQATYTEFYSGNGRPDIVLRQYPVLSVTNVWMDHTAYFGNGVNPFPTSSLLTYGQHYGLELDGEDGQGGYGGASGTLVRLGLGGTSGDFGRRYTLTGGYSPTCWAIGQGNIKVTYVAGYTPIPDDLALAVLQTAATVYKTRLMGGLRLGSEHLGKYGYALASGVINTDADGEMGNARGLLARYIRRSF